MTTVNPANKFSVKVPAKISAAVRPGRDADFVTGTPRIKRRVTAKYAFPIDVPGETSDIVDFINIDFTMSLPVVANERQIRSAVKAVGDSFFVSGSCLKDLVIHGHEPY